MTKRKIVLPSERNAARQAVSDAKDAVVEAAKAWAVSRASTISAELLMKTGALLAAEAKLRELEQS